MIKIIALLKRKEGMSREDFRKYYEENHLALCYENCRGYAVDYRRNYIEDQFGGGDDTFSDPTAERLDYDVVTEVWFRSREDIQEMLSKVEVSTIGEAMVKDEANLFDRPKHRFLICEEVLTDPVLLQA